jgi:hypothetical protein
VLTSTAVAVICVTGVLRYEAGDMPSTLYQQQTRNCEYSNCNRQLQNLNKLQREKHKEERMSKLGKMGETMKERKRKDIPSE